MQPPETRYAKSSDGTHLAYQVFGEGDVDLVWVQGFVSHNELAWTLPSWATFMRRLAAGARVILFDRRGVGQSDRTTDLPTLDNQLDDVRAVMDAAGSERAALLGVSEGGPMSILFAASYPDRASHLILFGSFPRLLRTADYPIGLEPKPDTLRFYEENWGSGFMLDVFAPGHANDPEKRRWFARYEREACSPGGIVATLLTVAQVDVRDVLPSVRIPTLVMTREGDTAVDPAHSRYMAERIPGAKLVILPGDDHIAALGDVDPFLAAVQEFLTGRRSQVGSDRVLGTVLFTDIVGSTERAAELGDADWRAVLEQHHRTVRRQIEHFRGREIKTTGDGFLAMFDGPTRAIQCALEASRALETIGVTVRAGLHTGECEVMGTDIGGIAVHIAARVAALAGPGEVLVSRTVRDLSAGSGITFQDRGSHELKGVPEPWELYSAREGAA